MQRISIPLDIMQKHIFIAKLHNFYLYFLPAPLCIQMEEFKYIKHHTFSQKFVTLLLNCLLVINMIWEGLKDTVMASFKVLSQYLFGRTE
jgi:hypothetical protein